MEITVKITGGKRTISYLNKVRSNLPKVTQETVRFMATSVKNLAQANVRSRAKYNTIDYMQNLKNKNHTPGLLADSINILTLNNSENGNRAEVGVEPSSLANEYAVTVEEGRVGGTRITPSKKKLRFAWAKAGGVVFPREVVQGKQQGMYYMRDAVLETSQKIRGKLQTESDVLLAK